MSTFAYTAIGRDGKRTNGTLTADNRAAAIAQVSRLGLHPVKVDESRNGKATAVAAPKAPARPAPEAAPRGGGLRGMLKGGAATPAKAGPSGAGPIPVLPLQPPTV